MAFLNCSTWSPAMEKCMQYNILIPENHTEDTPNLLLLHGLSDDYTMWQRYSVIERYAAERGMCVIMPDGGRSFYCDMKYGAAYYSSIVNDVMNSARSIFGISAKREKNFTAGLSMGGYGAMKIALRNPDKFAGCISLSGVLDINEQVRGGGWDKDFTIIWGENYGETVPGSEDDLFALVDSYENTDKPKPKIYSACGTEDFLYGANQAFNRHIDGKGFDFTYEEFPGNHNWSFWNEHIVRAIDVIMEE